MKKKSYRIKHLFDTYIFKFIVCSYLFKFLLGEYLKKKNKTVKDCGKIICLHFIFFSAKNNFLAFFWSVLNTSLILHQIMSIRFNEMSSLRVLEGLRPVKAVIWLHKIESLLNCCFYSQSEHKEGEQRL